MEPMHEETKSRWNSCFGLARIKKKSMFGRTKIQRSVCLEGIESRRSPYFEGTVLKFPSFSKMLFHEIAKDFFLQEITLLLS
jgi:hypothetical protein